MFCNIFLPKTELVHFLFIPICGTLSKRVYTKFYLYQKRLSEYNSVSLPGGGNLYRSYQSQELTVNISLHFCVYIRRLMKHGSIVLFRNRILHYNELPNVKPIQSWGRMSIEKRFTDIKEEIVETEWYFLKKKINSYTKGVYKFLLIIYDSTHIVSTFSYG